jgi:hypothetical protein
MNRDESRKLNPPSDRSQTLSYRSSTVLQPGKKRVSLQLGFDGDDQPSNPAPFADGSSYLSIGLHTHLLIGRFRSGVQL